MDGFVVIVPPMAWMVHDRGMLIFAVFFNFRLFLGYPLPSFGRFLSNFGPFLASWTLRRIPFYVFLHFFNLKVPCITRFQVPMGSTPAGPFKCTRTHDAVDPLTRLRQRAIQHDLGPYFWSTFVDFRPLFG